MQDQYAGQPGTFIVDPEAGIRVPAEDWDIYQADKAAYNADPDKARAAFEKRAEKAKTKVEVSDAQ
ncbi:hypothetical protein ACQE3E_15695 [Methylomonas sp. MED-D]|uniref:hypothetical protein n=1 Tax=unclassified Methylomonas TaxID=2608980 RepID=UPI003D01F628